ncbi:Phosphoglycerol transferase [hydrothermal vent metagenome]|uniref:Phosphoglycerol transferase n=1 Tax=hydrothermal vent metagenome TaxID=652676 RepID=A0A1W1CI64_9ZZZZ
MGFRFDLRAVANSILLFVYLPALFLVNFKKPLFFYYWTKFILGFLLIVIVLISFIDLGFYSFFGNEINPLIFGITEDGFTAVFDSFKDDINLVILSIISIFTMIFVVKIFNNNTKNIPEINSRKWWVQLIILLALMPLLVLAARGGWGTFPLSRAYISISPNTFINSLSSNGIYHLYDAVQDNKKNRLYQSTQEILKISKSKNLLELIKKSGFNENNPLIKITNKNSFLEENPPHIIFVQMEGWSSSIALTESKKTLGEFYKHSKEDYFFTHFLSNKYGTNPTLENLLLNSPITPLSQSNIDKLQFKTFNIIPYKKAGYQTEFLSSGYSSWRRLNYFWTNKFDKFLGRSTIEKKYNVSSTNPWGIYEENLFDLLKDEIKNSKDPLFSFVLTTNNHLPVVLPDNWKKPKFDMQLFNNIFNSKIDKKMLNAFSYQTDAFGHFMTWLKHSKFKDKVIVVATGDHVLKGFSNLNNAEELYMKYAVATYFYIPKKYDKLQNINLNIAGSHNDLFPTLFELSLSNTKYYNFGTAIMNKNQKTAYGYNDGNQNHTFITKEGMIDADKKMLYTWDKNNRLFVKKQGIKINNKQKITISKEKYRDFLKKFLIYQDIEK